MTATGEQAPPDAGSTPMLGKRVAFFVIVALITLAADEGSKVWARRTLGPREHQRTIQVVPGYFDLRLAYNTGTAFSLTRGGLAPIVLGIVGSVALAGIVVFALRSKEDQRSVQFALGLLAGGAAGNVFDRIYFRKVTDFVVWKVGKHEWPSFNVADAALLVGVGILIFAWPKAPAKPSVASPPDADRAT